MCDGYDTDDDSVEWLEAYYLLPASVRAAKDRRPRRPRIPKLPTSLPWWMRCGTPPQPTIPCVLTWSVKPTPPMEEQRILKTPSLPPKRAQKTPQDARLLHPTHTKPAPTAPQRPSAWEEQRILQTLQDARLREVQETANEFRSMQEEFRRQLEECRRRFDEGTKLIPKTPSPPPQKPEPPAPPLHKAVPKKPEPAVPRSAQAAPQRPSASDTKVWQRGLKVPSASLRKTAPSPVPPSPAPLPETKPLPPAPPSRAGGELSETKPLLPALHSKAGDELPMPKLSSGAGSALPAAEPPPHRIAALLKPTRHTYQDPAGMVRAALAERAAHKAAHSRPPPIRDRARRGGRCHAQQCSYPALRPAPRP
jgi:hypothetical protein